MESVSSIEKDVLAALSDQLGSLPVAGRADSWTEHALAEERAATSRMVEKRALEFLTGRTCARAVLRGLGFADAPLLPGPNRAPQWPAGAVGSITHTTGFCAATAGLADDYFGVGIDVERGNGVNADLESYVARPAEIERFTAIDDWRTLLFSAKESVFKCVNPPTGIWLEFHDVEVISLEQGRFAALVRPKDRQPFEVQGGWAQVERFVVSSVVLSRSDEIARSLG